MVLVCIADTVTVMVMYDSTLSRHYHIHMVSAVPSYSTGTKVLAPLAQHTVRVKGTVRKPRIF